MKRLDNLYNEICKENNINFEIDEVCRNTKNRKNVENVRANRTQMMTKIKKTLISRSYTPGKYHIFKIYEPKERLIISQNMFDKIVNHLVSRFIINPAVLPSLIDQNVASRAGLGIKAGIKFYQKYRRYYHNQYGKYYILRCDIHHFFQSIDHDILMKMIEKKIKDKDALNIIKKIIYSYKDGLGIGNMTSQILAIFYLNDFDHYVKEQLKIKGYVRYQDDFLLFSDSKEELQNDLKKINEYLKNNCKLELNMKKTRIFNESDNFIFLGRDIYGRYGKHKEIKRRVGIKKYLYRNGSVNLYSFACTVVNYMNVDKQIKCYEKLTIQ